jgi:hypothetical protein
LRIETELVDNYNPTSWRTEKTFWLGWNEKQYDRTHNRAGATTTIESTQVSPKQLTVSTDTLHRTTRLKFITAIYLICAVALGSIIVIQGKINIAKQYKQNNIEK